MNPVQWLAAIRFTYLSWKHREELSKLPAEAKQAFKAEVIEPMKAGYNTPIEVLNARRREANKPVRIAVGLAILALAIFLIGAAILGS